MEKIENTIYESPTLTVLRIKTEQGYALSSIDGSMGSGFHDPFIDFGIDPWGGDAFSEGSHFGSWVDNDNSAWDK